MPMNNSQIKWRILKALNALYENRKTPSTILSDGFVDYLTHTRRLLRRKLSNANYLEPCNGFAYCVQLSRCRRILRKEF